MDENAKLTISSDSVAPRDARAAEDLDTWSKVIAAAAWICRTVLLHQFDGEQGTAQIYNPKIAKGLRITFPTNELKSFTQWKMMGVHDYVMGLEPGNCNPDGRNIVREQGKLETLQPGEEKTFHVKVTMLDHE